MTVTLLDCMILAAFLVGPFIGFLYTMFINMLEVIDNWLKGGGHEY